MFNGEAKTTTTVVVVALVVVVHLLVYPPQTIKTVGSIRALAVVRRSFIKKRLVKAIILKHYYFRVGKAS